ncbi:MAG: addiction module protein [Ignavibacteriales bacterium]|nr:addiction module protein [Ignavibacteriales bacterium]MCF8438544.1 addiction module protein [Ignavibacteriales bacterium]
MNNGLNADTLENIKKLSISERILIVEDIWDSIFSSEQQFPMTEEQKKELDSRLEAYNKNPEEGKSWKEIKNNIQSRL